MANLKFKEFFAIIDNLSQEFGNKFIIALSGGGDSLALCALCAEYQKLNPTTEFEVAIIDHNIAKNSGEIAQNALETAQKIGINGKIYKVIEPINTRLQEKAREYRYKLLGKAAKDFGANIILIAHNFEDRIETFLFRLSRKTNLNGLGIMPVIAPNPFWGNEKTLIARPLLDFSRETLRNYLKENLIDYFNDPANINVKFSRVKIRSKLEYLQQNNLDINAIVKTINSANALNKASFEIIAKHLEEIKISDKIELPISILNLPVFLFEKIIETLIYSINLQAPELKKLQNLCENLKSEEVKKANLAGLNFIKRKTAFTIEIAKNRKSVTERKTINKAVILNAIYAKTVQFARFIEN